VNPHIRNFREWVLLLFGLFCVLDIAALQYGMILAKIASPHPNPVAGQIAAIIQGSRGSWHDVYVTPHQMIVFHGVLGAAAASLAAMLGLMVALGVRIDAREQGRARRRSSG
jgi:hypothetical protein